MENVACQGNFLFPTRAMATGLHDMVGNTYLLANIVGHIITAGE
jgi:hypothetical protein